MRTEHEIWKDSHLSPAAKKMLFLASVLVLVVSFVTVLDDDTEVQADSSGQCGDYIRWYYNSSECVLDISGRGDMYNYTLYSPAPWSEFPIKTVNILDNVRIIGDFAFSGCTTLESVSMTDSVVRIGYGAFNKCSSLSSVTIPNYVTQLGIGAFYQCTSLESITIPGSVTLIENDAFFYCTSLESITVSQSNNYYKSINGVLFDKSGRTLIQYPIGRVAEEYAVPGSVTQIKNDSFYGCDALKAVTIPESVTQIGDDAFSYCTSLLNIAIPGSVTQIGDYAFSNCTSLATVDIPSSVGYIGEYVFSECTALKTITIPYGIEYIGECAFDPLHYIVNGSEVMHTAEKLAGKKWVGTGDGYLYPREETTVVTVNFMCGTDVIAEPVVKLVSTVDPSYDFAIEIEGYTQTGNVAISGDPLGIIMTYYYDRIDSARTVEVYANQVGSAVSIAVIGLGGVVPDGMVKLTFSFAIYVPELEAWYTDVESYYVSLTGGEDTVVVLKDMSSEELYDGFFNVTATYTSGDGVIMESSSKIYFSPI